MHFSAVRIHIIVSRPSPAPTTTTTSPKHRHNVLFCSQVVSSRCTLPNLIIISHYTLLLCHQHSPRFLNAQAAAAASVAAVLPRRSSLWPCVSKTTSRCVCAVVATLALVKRLLQRVFIIFTATRKSYCWRRRL